MGGICLNARFEDLAVFKLECLCKFWETKTSKDWEQILKTLYYFMKKKKTWISGG